MKGFRLRLVVLAALLLPTVAGGGLQIEHGAGGVVNDPMAAPPHWQPGQWWRVHVWDAYTDTTLEATLVVVAADEAGYTVGVAESRSVGRVVAWHLPAAGRVNADLSYDVHGNAFQPVRFPVTPGDQWHARFGHIEYEATVKTVHGSTAGIVLAPHDPAWEAIHVTYDATVGTVTRVQLGQYAEVRVVDSGFGYACKVHVPKRSVHLLDVPRQPGQAINAQALAIPYVPSYVADRWTRSVEVENAFDRLMITMVVGGEETGAYLARAEAPDATVYQELVGPASDKPVVLAFHEHANPEGMWEFTGITRGQGVAYVDALAYSKELRLPDGARLGIRADEACVSGALPATMPAAGDHSTSHDVIAPSDATTGAAFAAAATGLIVALPLAWPMLRRWVAFGLFSRLARGRLLDNPVRKLVLEIVEGEPGLTAQEIRRRADVAWGTAMHHLGMLERHGMVTRIRWGREVDWFPTGYDNVRALRKRSAARRDSTRRVLEAVQARPGASQLEIATALKLHHTTVIFHAERMVAAGILEKRREGRTVRYFEIPSV